MKISQILTLTLLFASALAFADPINDPKIILHGAGGGALIPGRCEQCVNVGANFSFSVPPSGSGNLFFTNASGINWNSLTLVEKGVPAADISCRSDLFASCSTKTLKNGSVEILLGNGNTGWRNHGIPNGASFEISFSCVKGSCWPGGLKFNGHGSTNSMPGTPEPESIALMVTGLGVLVSRRKSWLNRLKA
jgi:hypothetical protein